MRASWALKALSAVHAVAVAAPAVWALFCEPSMYVRANVVDYDYIQLGLGVRAGCGGIEVGGGGGVVSGSTAPPTPNPPKQNPRH